MVLLCVKIKIMKKLFLIAFFAVFAALAVVSVSEAGIVSGLGEGVHVEDDASEGAHLTSESHSKHEKGADTGVHLDKDTHTGTGVHLDKDTHTGTGVHLDKDTHTGTGVHLDKDTHTGTGVHLDKDTHTGTGVHLSDLYDAKGAHDTGHAHIKGDADIELDKKGNCKVLLDCGCVGCQKSDGAVAAFLSVAESYVPAQYMPPVRTFATEYLSVALAFIYDELYGDTPQKPPKH